MSYSSLRSLYLENEVLNAPPERLVQILYELGIRSLASAKECNDQKDIPGRVNHINKAYAVLTELQSGLDFEKGGDIATNYARIYEYCQRRILESNVQQSSPIIAEVQGLLEDLNESWQIVVSRMSKARREAMYSAEPPPNAEEIAGTLSFVG